MAPALFRRNFDSALDPLTAQNALRIGVLSEWTPEITFATPGDLSVAYSFRAGTLTSIGKLRFLTFSITTSGFTHSTASGNFKITGSPVVEEQVLMDWGGFMVQWRGITKANYTQIAPRITGGEIFLQASGSGQTPVSIATGDMPTGGTVQLRGQAIFTST